MVWYLYRLGPQEPRGVPTRLPDLSILCSMPTDYSLSNPQAPASDDKLGLDKSKMSNISQPNTLRPPEAGRSATEPTSSWTMLQSSSTLWAGPWMPPQRSESAFFAKSIFGSVFPRVSSTLSSRWTRARSVTQPFSTCKQTRDWSGASILGWHRKCTLFPVRLRLTETSCGYFCQLVFQSTSAYALVIFPVKYWVIFNMTAWTIITMCTGQSTTENSNWWTVY